MLYNLRICKRNTAEHGQNGSTVIPAAQGRFTGPKDPLSSEVPAATIACASTTVYSHLNRMVVFSKVSLSSD